MCKIIRAIRHTPTAGERLGRKDFFLRTDIPHVCLTYPRPMGAYKKRANWLIARGNVRTFFALFIVFRVPCRSLSVDGAMMMQQIKQTDTTRRGVNNMHACNKDATEKV